MSSKRAAAKLLIAEQALRDLTDIEAYSIAQWGKRTAARYIADIEAALVRLQQQPSLLRTEESIHPQLSFYRVNRHLLIFDVQPKVMFLLTVIHANRDIPSRLAELEPTLAAEAELLHQRLRQNRPKG